MLHAREDYQRIQDPDAPTDDNPEGRGIAVDEPVFLLRAKDSLAPGIVRAWARELHRMAAMEGAGARQEELLATARAAWAHADRMEEWANLHGGAKVPDAPLEAIDEDAAHVAAAIQLHQDLEHEQLTAKLREMTPQQLRALADEDAARRELERRRRQAEVESQRGVPAQLTEEQMAQARDSGRASA